MFGAKVLMMPKERMRSLMRYQISGMQWEDWGGGGVDKATAQNIHQDSFN